MLTAKFLITISPRSLFSDLRSVYFGRYSMIMSLILMSRGGYKSVDMNSKSCVSCYLHVGSGKYKLLPS